jgi:hypothetical protein
LSSEQDPQSRIVNAINNSVLDTHLDVIHIKYDVRSIISLLLPLAVLSILNFFLLFYCAVSLWEIKQSPTPSKAVQMEANQ